MRHWKQWILVASATWLVVALIVASERSSCGSFWSQPCLSSGWRSFGDIILLGWVEDFQTLLGGLAALAAGAFVLWATRMQIDEAKSQRADDNKRKILSMIAACRSDLIHAMNHLEHSDPLMSKNELPFLRANLSDLAAVDGSLMHISYSVLYRLEAALKKRLAPNWPIIANSMADEMNRCCAAAGVLSELLKQVADKIRSGTFVRLNVNELDSTHVTEFLTAKGLTQLDLRELSMYFVWPDKARNPGT